MKRNFLATTAIAVLLATGAYAQNATDSAPATPAPATTAPANDTAAQTPTVRADGQIASNIIGESVYDGTGEDAQSIGKVSDILFDKDGKAKSVVIGVGGFLGIGSKDVAFDYDKLKWAEKNGDRWLVAETSKDALTKQQAFDSTPYEPKSNATNAAAPGDGTAPATTAMAPASGTANTDTTAMAPANGDAAQKVETGGQGAAATPHADGELATNIMGEAVYNGTGDDAQNIGDVNDIVLDKSGQSTQLVIGVGGFLGLGEKNVAFDYDKVKPAEKNGDRWLVVSATKDQLQSLPAFDRKAYDPAPASTAAADNAPAMTAPAADNTVAATDNTATATKDTAAADNSTAANDTAAADNTATAADATQTSAIDKSSLTEMPQDKISADTLIGTTVYGANDAKVGEIGDVILSSDNKVDAIVIDVGGFLGIGSKPVAVGMDKLKFMTDKDGNRYLYTNFTKDQLNAQTAYDKSSYAQNRDKQRMSVQ